MNVGDRVKVAAGASDWMKLRGYWLNEMPDTLDGMDGEIVSDYTDLGESAHFCVRFGEFDMEEPNLGVSEWGVPPQFLVPYNTRNQPDKPR